MWQTNLISGLAILLIGLFVRVFRLSNLIAGYNTLPKEKKKKYDEKELTKYVGNLLMIAPTALLAGGIFSTIHPGAGEIILTSSWLLFVLCIIAGGIYINLSDKVKK